MYLTESLQGAAGVVGSSNFTKRGWAAATTPTWEINLATGDGDTLAELREWFDRLWSNEQQTEDVKQRVLDALHRLATTMPRRRCTTRRFTSCSATRSTPG